MSHQLSAMVQLSLSQFRRLSPPGEEEKERGRKMTKQKQHSPASSPAAFSPQSVHSSTATSLSQAYETYIENGLICLKHKIRNIEKKKVKLEDYKERLDKGEALNQDQTEAVEKYDETLHNLEFAKELHKTFSALSQDLLKVQKKTQRREQALRMEAEKKRLRTVLQVHYVLQNLSQEHIQKDFKDGLNGAMYVSSKELNYLVRFSKLVSLERDEKLSLEDQMEDISLYLWELLEGSEKAVAGTTYKRLKELLGSLLECGYFECIPFPHSEMQEQEVVLKEPEIQKPKENLKTLKELGIIDKAENRERSSEMSELLQNEVPLAPREFLNRHYAPEAEYELKAHEDAKSFFSREEPPDSWDMQPVESIEKQKRPLITKPWEDSLASKEQEPKKCVAKPREKREIPQKHVVQPKQVSKPEQQPPALEFISSNSSKSLPNDPALRQQELQDIIAQFQGTCNFMQDSMLDFDKSSASPSPLQRSPCTLTASPKVSKEQSLQNQNETVQSTAQATLPEELHVLSSPPASVTADDRSLSGSEMDLHLSPPRKASVSMPSEEMSFIPSQSFEKEAIITEPVVRKTSIDTTQVKMSLPVEPHQEPPVSAPLSTVPTEQAFQSTVATTTTTPTTSTPFQAVHTVFKVNATLPQRNEKEVKMGSAFSTSFNQSYTTASTQTPPQSLQQPIHKTEPSIVVQESLQTALGTYHPEGTSVSSSNVSYLPQQPSGFHRPNQAYFNNRGSVRGTLRGGRGAVASYRPQNGFKAGFDSYRGGTHVVQNGIYIQPAYPGRDYPGMPCTQRESVSQQNYKRGGSVGGPRINSRGAGWSDSSQLSSPERDNETLHSGDSGQGDSRSITPVDGPITSQATTVLPMHVYPLPQQMRVAFSTARTSNFAPGTLDQPIVFDLLLNNLGETFDIQLGRFTCPVNGTYVFIFHMLKLAVNVPLYVNLMKNEEVLVSAYANDGAPDHETASNHAVLQLFQGDQIWLRLHRGAIYGSSWKYSTFSGYLLYQD